MFFSRRLHHDRFRHNGVSDIMLLFQRRFQTYQSQTVMVPQKHKSKISFRDFLRDFHVRRNLFSSGV